MNQITPLHSATPRHLPKRLLGVWAHPDDEAYMSAGLMGRVIAAGGHVTVVTATLGERGTDDPTRFGSAAFARTRHAELISSLAILGVHDVRTFGYADGGCEGADDESSVDRIVDAIVDVDPDTIVTFGPDGITGHPDHAAVSAWTSEAWRRTDSSELLYATMTHDFIRRNRDLHARVGFFTDFGDGRPTSVSRTSVALECVLTRSELARKRRALAAHATQTTRLAAAIGERRYTAWWGRETFRSPTPIERNSALATGRAVIGAA